MDQLARELQQFALTNFQLELLPNLGRGIQGFAVGEQQEVFFEPYQELVLVYCRLRVERSLPDKYLAALKLCHFSQPQRLPLQVGLESRTRLIFLTALAKDKVSAAALQAAFSQVYSSAQQVLTS